MADSIKIREVVASNADRFVQTLKEACSIPSVSAEGQGLAEMAAWLESKLKELGASVSRLQVRDAPPPFWVRSAATPIGRS